MKDALAEREGGNALKCYQRVVASLVACLDYILSSYLAPDRHRVCLRCLLGGCTHVNGSTYEGKVGFLSTSTTAVQRQRERRESAPPIPPCV